MFSIFEYTDGVFQLNVWGFVLAMMLIGALGEARTIVRRK